ncbi:OLC1v1024749C1 [Oldenlandia corymbosa var. corymbosa]|uniref:OLC1v1024749C1 n=1 Tax=Oldenlandia corymbosa var. corymbosa TaxID=529605 RepID=A0AAV1C370_OLDCO|nr:OLC1v1024749C1 [Oldenlandia corymbosa var. corymbosa]
MSSKGNEEPHQNSAENNQAGNHATTGWMGMMQQQYRRIKENAETYPYVWGSYIVVYGGFGLWFAYRFRKLRRTEDRVRVLQERLRKLVETEESAGANVAEKAPPTLDKPKN